MKRARLATFLVLALIAAAIFIRLGIWQLHRRQQRLALNALITGRLDSSVVDVSALPRDTALDRFRRVRVHGVPDYEHELIYATRTYMGSPGINFLTPVRIPGRDTAVLVNRGWVYSPDGATVDLARWRERDSVFTGFVENLPPSGGRSYASRPEVIARLGYDVVSKRLPYPVAPIYVVELGDSAVAPNRVGRLSVPPLDEGPHLNYAIQWFGFAVVTLAGAGVVFKQSLQGESPTRGEAFPSSRGGSVDPG